MDQRFRAFLLVSQTLNMSRAAEISFVSPQCISGHIRSLEEQYGVQLLTRYPKMELTPDGVALVAVLQKIEMLENQIEKTLKSPTQQITGKLSIGLPISRYAELVPKIAIPFKEQYPYIELEILDGRNSEVEWQVSNGFLDLAIASRQINSPDLQRIPLLEDSYIFLISDQLIQNVYRMRSREVVEKFSHGITVDDFSQFPLVMNSPKVSRLRRAMDQYALEKNLCFHIVLEANRFDIFDCLVRKNLVAGMIPHMMLETTVRNNAHIENDDQYVHTFPVILDSIPYKNPISLVMHKKGDMTVYKAAMINIIQKQFAVYEQAQKRFQPLRS